MAELWRHKAAIALAALCGLLAPAALGSDDEVAAQPTARISQALSTWYTLFKPTAQNPPLDSRHVGV
jgi:hypothetical protein